MKQVFSSPHGSYRICRASNCVYVCYNKEDDAQCCYVGLMSAESKAKLIAIMADNNIGFSGIEVRRPVKRIDPKFKWEAKVKGISADDALRLADIENTFNRSKYPEVYESLKPDWE